MRIVLRIILGGILLTAAGAKLLDLPGFVLVLRSYAVLPRELLWPAALGVIAGELMVGIWLCWGRRLFLAAYASLALHLVYASVATIILLQGKTIISCGCFGSYLSRPLSWWTVGQNLVLITLSLTLAWLARRDSGRT